MPFANDSLWTGAIPNVAAEDAEVDKPMFFIDDEESHRANEAESRRLSSATQDIFLNLAAENAHVPETADTTIADKGDNDNVATGSVILVPPQCCCECNEGCAAESVAEPSIRGPLLALLVCFLGLFEGYFFSHSGMFAPATFTRQFRLENFLILKMFVSAVGTSMIAQSAMSAFHFAQFEKSRAYRQDNNGWLQVIGGCAILGIGMGVAGSGPTMLPSQIGAGVETSGMILVGCIAGGGVYALCERVFGFRTSCQRAAEDKIVVEDLVPTKLQAFLDRTLLRWVNMYQLLAMPMGMFMIGCGFLVDYLSPHSSDAAELGLPPYATGCNFSGSARTVQVIFFHPIMAGIVVGLNQIPLRFIYDDGQGGSTSVMNMVAFLSRGYLSSRHSIRSWKQATQFIYVFVGTLIGGAIGFVEMTQTAHSSGSALREKSLGDSTWSPWRVFIGGFFMIFGARLAGGCTCGHGVSGVSELSLQSFAGAGAMFGMGIAVTFAIGL